jgi:hypothetical protein
MDKTTFSNTLTDDLGFQYIESLPKKAKRASIFDFVTIDLNVPEKYYVNANMTYLVASADRSRYYIRTVHEGLQDTILTPLLNSGQVFIVD